ncbi:hypothetical protein ACFVUN_35835 [Kitasatospora griseola]|uniref:hypothetical protein n=1 Tax=Kitasatospora griseola TaxID=2064 RepID=UPI0036DA1C79
MSEPMLFGAPTCSVCGGGLPPRKGTGRRPKYCSKACSSKADRQRDRERRDALAAAADSAESPRGETASPAEDVLRPLDVPVGAVADGEELLEAAAELHRQTKVFLLQLDRAARNSDPDLLRSAGADMRAAAYVLSARHRELVGQLLDGHPLAPPAPAVDPSAPPVSPREETPSVERIAAAVGADLLAAPAPADPGPRPRPPATAPSAESPRGETKRPEAGTEDVRAHRTPADTPRGETAAPAAGGTVPTSTPRGETPAAPGTPVSPAPAAERRLRGLVDQRLAQQSAGGARGTAAPAPGAGTVAVPRDPLLRGLPRGMDVRVPLDERTFGFGWVLAGWTVRPDVLVVLGEGHQVGWVEHGLDGGDGWVAVHDGFFLGDPVTQQAALHATPHLAARAIHHAHVHDLRAGQGA